MKPLSHVGCSQLSVSVMWSKDKQTRKAVKGKHAGRPRKTSKHQDRKLQAVCLDIRTCMTKGMKNKWAET